MKHGRPPSEVAALAERLRATRREGEPIGAWLDRYHAELRALIPAGWTWDQVAEAMNAAGIRYAAGRVMPGGRVSRGEWTGLLLQRDVRRAGRLAHRRAAARPALLGGDAPPRPVVPRETPKATRREDVRQLAGQSRPPIPVFGATVAEPPSEPGSVQRLADEKSARAQSVIDAFLSRRKDHGSKG